MARKHLNNGSKSRRGNFSASPRCRFFKNVGPSTQSTYEKEFNIIFSEVGPISIYYSYLKQVTFNRSLKPGACDFHVPVLRPFHRRSNFGALRHELRISSKCHKPASQTYRPENDTLTFQWRLVFPFQIVNFEWAHKRRRAFIFTGENSSEIYLKITRFVKGKTPWYSTKVGTFHTILHPPYQAPGRPRPTISGPELPYQAPCILS